MKRLISIFFILTVNNVFGQKSTYQNIKIEPYLALQNYEHFKRLVLISTEGQVDYIDNFEFKWGYDFELKIKATKLNQPLTDGTTHKYSLEKIIKQTKLADTAKFELILSPSRYYYKLEATEEKMNKSFVQINDSVYFYLDAVEIEVPRDLLQPFKVMIDNETIKTGTFNYLSDNRIRLIDLK